MHGQTKYKEVKSKVQPITVPEGTDGEYLCSSTLSLTSALDAGE